MYLKFLPITFLSVAFLPFFLFSNHISLCVLPFPHHLLLIASGLLPHKSFLEVAHDNNPRQSVEQSITMKAYISTKATFLRDMQNVIKTR